MPRASMQKEELEAFRQAALTLMGMIGIVPVMRAFNDAVQEADVLAKSAASKSMPTPSPSPPPSPLTPSSAIPELIPLTRPKECKVRSRRLGPLAATEDQKRHLAPRSPVYAWDPSAAASGKVGPAADPSKSGACKYVRVVQDPEKQDNLLFNLANTAAFFDVNARPNKLFGAQGPYKGYYVDIPEAGKAWYLDKQGLEGLVGKGKRRPTRPQSKQVDYEQKEREREKKQQEAAKRLHELETEFAGFSVPATPSPPSPRYSAGSSSSARAGGGGVSAIYPSGGGGGSSSSSPSSAISGGGGGGGAGFSRYASGGGGSSSSASRGGGFSSFASRGGGSSSSGGGSSLSTPALYQERGSFSQSERASKRPRLSLFSDPRPQQPEPPVGSFFGTRPE